MTKVVLSGSGEFCSHMIHPSIISQPQVRNNMVLPNASHTDLIESALEPKYLHSPSCTEELVLYSFAPIRRVYNSCLTTPSLS
jgi:hypothetical protein